MGDRLPVEPGTPLIDRLDLYTSYGWALLPILPATSDAEAGDRPGKSPFRKLLVEVYGDPEN